MTLRTHYKTRERVEELKELLTTSLNFHEVTISDLSALFDVSKTSARTLFCACLASGEFEIGRPRFSRGANGGIHEARTIRIKTGVACPGRNNKRGYGRHD